MYNHSALKLLSILCSYFFFSPIMSNQRNFTFQYKNIFLFTTVSFLKLDSVQLLNLFVASASRFNSTPEISVSTEKLLYKFA